MRSSLIHLAKPPTWLDSNSAAWPASFADLPNPPLSVGVAGALPPLEGAVAIVGTRFADADAIEFTRHLAEQLATRGRTIISGGARGIDAAAHAGALAADEPTLAVLATGMSRAYPKEHGPLFTQIAHRGALLCEGPEVERPAPHGFLKRNRLIAALASCVIVVQAPVRSGALSTALWAKRLKRPVFSVPSAPWESRGEGSNELLRRGARICTSAADVLSVPASSAAQGSLPGLTCAEEAKDNKQLSEAGQRVLAALGRRGRHPDDLARTLDMSVAAVQEALLILVLGGFLRQTGDGTYVRARN